MKYIPITADKEYHVMAISLLRGTISMLVEGDDGRPWFIKLDQVSIADPRLPDDWFFGVSKEVEIGLWARWGYERFATDSFHHDHLIERQPEALRCFEAQAERYREEFPSDLRVIVKNIYVGDKIPLKSFCPERKDHFGAWVSVQIGPDIEEKTFIYQMLVCTPNWIENEYRSLNAVWGRHMLIVFQYDPNHIQSEIEKYVAQCTGKSFWEIAQKIARVGAWEFEDY
jgi:hypothetical protein